MYGEGNSAKLLGDIINGTTQVTEGLSSGMGLDIKSLIAGAIGGKQTSPVIVMDKPDNTAAPTQPQEPPAKNDADGKAE